MAGDWIKWEKGLAGKLEVLRMAAALRRTPAEIAGACMMLWEWADSNVGDDGIAHGVDLETLAALQDRCSGVTQLCAQLVSVGWLQATEAGVAFANFCRHNGKSAKIRAQNLDRLKRFRNAPTVSKALPEKRREEIVSTSVETDAPSTTKRFTPPTVEDVRAFAEQHNLTMKAEEFADYYASKGWKVGNVAMKDWRAAARNWARRDAEKRNGTSTPAKGRPLAWSEVEEAAAKERREREAAKARAQLESQRRADAEGERRRREAQWQNARDAADLARALADRAALARYETEALPERSPLLQMAWGANGPTNTAAHADYLAWWRSQTALSPQMGAGGLSTGGQPAETRQSGPRGGLAGNETTTGRGE